MEGVPPRGIEWTGERCVPWVDEAQGICEHLHRYRFASSFAVGGRVLDLGSGEGYGAAMLAREASSVVGVDIDAASIAHARRAYAMPNLTFEERSVFELHELGRGAFDLVTCLEVMEHVERQDELVSLTAELLADDGVLVVSSPDRDAYNRALPEPNPFHVRELDADEFAALVSRHFPNVAMWGQTSVVASRLERLRPDDRDGLVRESFVGRIADRWEEVPRAEPMFYVAVASRAPLPPLPRLDYLVDPGLEALRERDRRLALLQPGSNQVRPVRTRLALAGYRRVRARLFPGRSA